MLDAQMLSTMPSGTRFATGEAPDSEDGLHMARTGKMLRWVAIRGRGPLDWAIYCHFADRDLEWIARSGDKVHFLKNIQSLVPCDDEAIAEYRK